jgi:hypothetical protein
MDTPSLILADPPELSAETASEMLDFLYQLVTAFENQYANQLRQYHHSAEPPEPDRVEDFDDELPDF